jgi:hypothetical protein
MYYISVYQYKDFDVNLISEYIVEGPWKANFQSMLIVSRKVNINVNVDC